MANINQIKIVLERIIQLLQSNGAEDVSSGLTNSLYDLDVDPVLTVACLRQMYGGMGSFNDLILHKDGKPLGDENDELDKLRDELFQLCLPS